MYILGFDHTHFGIYWCIIAFDLEKEEALAKKEKEMALKIAKNLLDVLTVEEIAKRTGLTVEEVAELAKK